MKKKKTGELEIQRRNRRRHRIKIAVALLSIFVLLGLVVMSAMALYVKNNVNTRVDLSLFESAGGDTVSRLYYFDEAGVAVELADDRLYGSQVTVYTSIDRVPKTLIDAFVAIEDKRFYSHHGVDWYRTAAAGFNYVFRTRDTFGASTITQQLIKNVTGSDEVKISRKVQEIFYALDLEEKLDKDEILELYLNIVNLAEGCYGVGAAAEKYFSKSVDELDLLESAAIAAITKNPSYYDPIKHPENNRERREVILSQMLEQGYISSAEYDSVHGKELTLNIGREASTINSWYADMVVEDIINDLCTSLGYTRAAASYLVYNGGLRIYTAQDPRVQAEVEAYYADESNFPSDDRAEGRSGIIVIDPASGNVLGVAGSIGEKTANRVQNYATTSKRPSGSAIKPLSVYAPALEEGIITWASVYDDVPLEFYESGGKTIAWPSNADKVYRGLSNVNAAIEGSLNTVSVKVLYDLGLDTSIHYLERFGIESLLDKDRDIAPLALGQQTYGVTLRELTAAYSVLANGGVSYSSRSYITVMTSDGKVLLDNTSVGERVLSEGNAAVMTKLLQNVVEEGSASATVSLREHVEVAAKTGTTQNSCDRWFVGYTPEYICGVWYGHEYPSTLPQSTLRICSTVFNAVMSELHADDIQSGEKLRFDIPENVIRAAYCRDSGALMTSSCMLDPRGLREERGWFVDGTQPKSFCECHITVSYDYLSEGVSTPHCPVFATEDVGLIQVVRSFPTEVTVTDAQYVWRYLPDNIAPSADEALPFFSPLLGEGEYCGVSAVERQFNSGCNTHIGYFYRKSD